MQGATFAEATKYIHDILHVRQHLNKQCKGGRAYQLISYNGKKFVANGKLSKSFWRRFENDYPSLTRKRQGQHSAKGVFACTEAMVRQYLDDLAEELIWTGIFMNAKQIEPGVWTGSIDTSHMFNHDEMPQFIDYGVSSSATRVLTYCGRGEKCELMKQENREYVTIEPYVSFDGEILMCHIIFPGTCISSHMAPKTAVEKISNLLVSTTNSVYQDGRTSLASYKMFAKAIKQNKVQKPIVVLTDGHSSRYDADVMQFYRKEDIHRFMGLTDTTELKQLLGQVFANLHPCYSNEKDQVFDREKVN